MPVPLLEAFALPIPVERATTQRPHANMYVITMPDALSIMHSTRIYISTIGIYRCCNHDRDFESCEVSSSQERASSKRFPIITHPPAQPISGLCGRYAPAKLVKKIHFPNQNTKKIHYQRFPPYNRRTTRVPKYNSRKCHPIPAPPINDIFLWYCKALQTSELYGRD